MATRVEPLRGRLARLPLASVRPWHVLAALVAVQWAAIGAFAVTVRHNRWVYYQGGDQIYHYTSGWLLAHGQLPNTPISYGWPVLMAPVARVVGPSFVNALPVMQFLNVVVLLPVALLAIYGIGVRVAGRAFGLFAATLWVVFPWLGVQYTDAGYHQRYTEIFLPQATGLTGLVDLPSTVALLVGAYLCVRALETRNWADGALGGLAAGVGIGIKASNLLFLPFPLLALAAARRWRQLLAFAAAVVPSLVVLTVWKWRGLGYVPAFSAPGPGASLAAAAVGLAGILGPIDRYVKLDWTHLHDNVLGIKEHFWSVRLVQWAPIAGMLAFARRSLPLLLLVGGWFCAYFFVKGSYAFSSVEDASFFRFLMPAFPAFLLLCAAIVLLLPGALPRLRRPPARELPARAGRIAVAVGVLATGLVPLGAVAAATPLEGPSPRAVDYRNILVPVTDSLRPTVRRLPGGGRRITWPEVPRQRARTFYTVLRAKAGPDVTCSGSGGADVCALKGTALGTTRSTSFVDREPGRWSYRVGVSANWLDDVHGGDVYLVSPPVAAPGA
jgi:hypothetical protein